MDASADSTEIPILREHRVLVTWTEVRIGRFAIPVARVGGVRVERDGILLPLALVLVFIALCLSSVRIEDEVGSAVFALAAVLALLATLFPRHALLLDAGTSERRVLAGWNIDRLARYRQAIETARLGNPSGSLVPGVP